MPIDHNHPLQNADKTREYIQRVKAANRPSVMEGATYLALYFNRPAAALTAEAGGQIIGFDGLKDLGFNVFAEATRTGKSQIVQPLQPRLSPIGGTYETLRAAEGLGQVVDGVFDMCDFTGLMGSLVTDGACTGEGYGLIEADPVSKDFAAIKLDPLETFYNNDRTEVVTTRMISRRRALAWFGGSEEKDDRIRALPKYEPDRLVEVDSPSAWEAEDNVALYCFWAEKIGRLKGRQIIQLGDPDRSMVVNGDWEHPLPVFSFPWDRGYRGQNDAKPLGRTIAPMHYWINQIVRKMHDAAKGIKPVVVGGKDPKWSDVPYEFIKQEPGEAAVQVYLPKAISEDLRQLNQDIREQVYRETGLSEDAAAGAAPAQYKSGVALSTWRKIVNEALNQQHRAYEQAWKQASRIIVSMAPKVYATKKARAMARGTDIIEQIDFSKVNLPEDSYAMSFDVVSDLPKTLPEKLNMMAFAEEKGWVDADEVLIHINVVDFKAAAKRRAGPRALINLQISRALTDGVLIPPSEVQDAAKLAELAGQAYQAAQAQHLQPPRENMQALLHLYLLAKARVQPPALPAPPAPDLSLPPLTPEVAPPLPTGTVAPPAAPLPIV